MKINLNKVSRDKLISLASGYEDGIAKRALKKLTKRKDLEEVEKTFSIRARYRAAKKIIELYGKNEVSIQSIVFAATIASFKIALEAFDSLERQEDLKYALLNTGSLKAREAFLERYIDKFGIDDAVRKVWLRFASSKAKERSEKYFEFIDRPKDLYLLIKSRARKDVKKKAWTRFDKLTHYQLYPEEIMKKLEVH